MNLPHLHILLNHIPTIGFSLGVTLFLAALVTKSQDLKRASLAILFFIAILSVAVYVSGNAAVDTLCPPGSECMPGVAKKAISAHENLAFMALALMQLTGAFAFLGLWRMRRVNGIGIGTSSALVVLSVLTFGLMAWAATVGGEIRHPEIVDSPVQAAQGEGDPDAKPRISAPDAIPDPGIALKAAPQAPGATPEAAPATAAKATPETASEAADAKTANSGWFTPGATKAFILGGEWVWPASEALHFVGLCLLFTVVLVANLRILGMAKGLPMSAVHKILPWGLLGFGMNVVTGMMFFVASPEQYTGNWVFFWKLVFIVLAGANTVYFLVFDETWKVGPNGDAPLRSKIAAVSSIVLWIGVVFCGHMLPFLGNSF